MSLLRSPMTSLADRRLSLVSGTKHRCICGLRSSICTTAEKILSAPTSSYKNSRARLKYFSVSSFGRRSKNPGLAVTMVSINLTLSFRTLHFLSALFHYGAGSRCNTSLPAAQDENSSPSARYQCRDYWRTAAFFFRGVFPKRTPVRPVSFQIAKFCRV